jgi:hypothetical protein
MVNSGEALLNVVTKAKRQDAFTLGPKGTWSSLEVPNSFSAAVVPPAERRDLTHTVTATQRGKPSVSPSGKPLSRGKATRKGSRWDGG